MKTVKLQIEVSSDGSSLIFKSVGTVWGDINISSLTIKTYTEDKSTPIHIYKLDAGEISNLSVNDLQADTESIIPSYNVSDNLYIIVIEGVDVDTSAIKSNNVCLGFSYVIEKLVRNLTLDNILNQMYNRLNISPNDIMKNIINANSQIMLNALAKLSTSAEYSYDREISWRKINQVLYSYYGN